MNYLQSVLFVALFVLSATVSAQVSVRDAWVRATVPAQKSTGAFMQLQAAQPVRLVGVRSPVAGVVEIHEMAMVGNVMRMRAVPGVDLPAGQPVDLKPGGYHVMLMDLKGQVKEGQTVPLTLVVEGADRKRQSVEVKAQVRPLTQAASEHHKH